MGRGPRTDAIRRKFLGARISGGWAYLAARKKVPSLHFSNSRFASLKFSNRKFRFANWVARPAGLRSSSRLTSLVLPDVDA